MMKQLMSDIPMQYKEVVRVSSNNNFNSTEKEFAQLAGFVAANPTKYFFINSNINTPGLLNVNKYPYKIVVTLNPDLIVRDQDITRLYQIKKDLVAFVRVKYIPRSQPIVDLIQELSEAGYNTVVTIQRYNGLKTLLKYGVKEDYKFECNRFRLHGDTLNTILKIADSTPNTFICDRKGLGCSGCGMCSTLTHGEELLINKLDMSTSGICPFNCPDCYSKTMQRFSIACGNNPIAFDKIHQNMKQKGTTKHILQAKANFK